MKYIVRFIGGLEHIKNGKLEETDAKGKRVVKGAYGRGHFGGEQGFVPNWSAKNFKVDLPQDQIDKGIKALKLIHDQEYLSTADGSNPFDPAWTHPSMKLYIPFTNKIFDTENPVDNLWIAILRNDPDLYYLDSKPPASMASVRWNVEQIKTNQPFDTNFSSDNSSEMLDISILLSEACTDDKIEVLSQFKDYSYEFLNKLTNRELTKHLFKLFEENTLSKFNKTVLFTLNSVVNKTEIDKSVDDIYAHAMDNAHIELSGEVFMFQDVVLGKTPKEVKSFLGKPENREVLKRIGDTVA